MNAATELFSPWDMEIASINFEARCGHGALAAALGIEVCDVMQYFDFGGWVNVPAMEHAIRRARRLPARFAGWAPDARPAVTIIQFLGPWMAPNVPAAARCQQRHWIAARDGSVWDCNTAKWQTQTDWAAEVPYQLMPKRGTGYEPFRTLVILPQPLQPKTP